ncbi:hypothetical protein L9F63_000572, partial [Diploptera punctata]
EACGTVDRDLRIEISGEKDFSPVGLPTVSFAFRTSPAERAKHKVRCCYSACDRFTS